MPANFSGARLWRTIAFVLVAFVSWAAAGTTMLRIPQSPHYRMLQAMQALESFRDRPDSPRANEVFDEFLTLG